MYSETVPCHNEAPINQTEEQTDLCTAIMYRWKINGFSQDPNCLNESRIWPSPYLEYLTFTNVYFPTCIFSL